KELFAHDEGSVFLCVLCVLCVSKGFHRASPIEIPPRVARCARACFGREFVHASSQLNRSTSPAFRVLPPRSLESHRLDRPRGDEAWCVAVVESEYLAAARRR